LQAARLEAQAAALHAEALEYMAQAAAIKVELTHADANKVY
jgi:hypothetical protein